MSSDQYRIQDERRVEAERESIARLYLPRSQGGMSAEFSEKVGKLFTLIESADIQQKTNSGAEDWQDISLNNIAEVMKRTAAA